VIIDKIQIRPRYGEVDQMGYVYHANYVSYCHFARTELLRKYGINDSFLEQNNIMLPVIEMNLRYLKPAYYDKLLNIKTCIYEIPLLKFYFNFIITNTNQEKICTADSTLVFVDSETRKPMKVPELIEEALKKEFEIIYQK
jgi:acyl-CoA thioester hydrolase